MPYDTDSDPYAALDKRKYDYKKTILPALAGMVSGSALSAMRGNSPRQATINAMLGGVGGGAGAFGNALEQQSTYNKELANLINQNLWKQKEFGQKQARYDTDAAHKSKKMELIDKQIKDVGKPKQETPLDTEKIYKRLYDINKDVGEQYKYDEDTKKAMRTEADRLERMLLEEKERPEETARRAAGEKPAWYARRERNRNGQPRAGISEATQLELPATIQTTSQAVKYLGGRHGMDQNTAVQWLRKNYGQD